jgi:hypothetical protein
MNRRPRPVGATHAMRRSSQGPMAFSAGSHSGLTERTRWRDACPLCFNLSSQGLARDHTTRMRAATSPTAQIVAAFATICDLLKLLDCDSLQKY